MSRHNYHTSNLFGFLPIFTEKYPDFYQGANQFKPNFTRGNANELLIMCQNPLGKKIKQFYCRVFALHMSFYKSDFHLNDCIIDLL